MSGCLKCLKYTMCVANFLCFICGTSVLGLGIYMMVNFRMAALTPSLSTLNLGHALVITGVIITCLSFLGFMGALKENRCLLLTFFLMLFLLMLVELVAACMLLLYEPQISKWLKEDLDKGLNKAKGANNATVLYDWELVQTSMHCCGVSNASDWGNNVPKSCQLIYYSKGCFEKMKAFFEENFLYTGISVIVICIIEVLGMCFAMTLFCHISRTGLGFKL